MTETEANLQETLELFESMGKPVPFRGRLSPKQIADGMNAVARNATRLVNDAEVLLEAKR